jgi:hypothetical protein
MKPATVKKKLVCKQAKGKKNKDFLVLFQVCRLRLQFESQSSKIISRYSFLKVVSVARYSHILLCCASRNSLHCVPIKNKNEGLRRPSDKYANDDDIQLCAQNVCSTVPRTQSLRPSVNAFCLLSRTQRSVCLRFPNGINLLLSHDAMRLAT